VFIVSRLEKQPTVYVPAEFSEEAELPSPTQQEENNSYLIVSIYQSINKRQSKMKKILFMIGSLRKQSFNREVSELVKNLLQGKAEVTELDYSAVPLMNQDIEYPAPQAVSDLRRAVSEADGVWIFSPEYNYSYPGHVKNIIDWLSRPVDPNNREAPTVLAGKKFTLTGAGGKAATAGCRKQLTSLLTVLKADVMIEGQTGIALNLEAWTEGRMILTDEQKDQLARQAELFLKFIA
jgi:chromate reductase